MPELDVQPRISIDDHSRIAVVGGGKMGAALVGGMIASSQSPASAICADNIVVVNPGEERRAFLEETYDVSCVADVSLVECADVVFLAVKPQILPSVLDDIAQSALGEQVAAHRSPLFVSIAAGAAIADIKSRLPQGARVVRVMPNMPLRVMEGASGVAGDGSNDADVALVNDLFACFGTSSIVGEGDLDAVTAVSGSGPAYVCALIEAMRDGGVNEGLSREVSEQLALQTVFGTAAYIMQSGTPVHEVLESICSPGGTTLAGLAAMEEQGFSASVIAGEQACANRSRELGA